MCDEREKVREAKMTDNNDMKSDAVKALCKNTVDQTGAKSMASFKQPARIECEARQCQVALNSDGSSPMTISMTSPCSGSFFQSRTTDAQTLNAALIIFIALCGHAKALKNDGRGSSGTRAAVITSLELTSKMIQQDSTLAMLENHSDGLRSSLVFNKVGIKGLVFDPGKPLRLLSPHETSQIDDAKINNDAPAENAQCELASQNKADEYYDDHAEPDDFSDKDKADRQYVLEYVVAAFKAKESTVDPTHSPGTGAVDTRKMATPTHELNEQLKEALIIMIALSSGAHLHDEAMRMARDVGVDGIVGSAAAHTDRAELYGFAATHTIDATAEKRPASANGLAFKCESE